MFGVLVTLHEFGHFIAARLTGVTVVEFAVGFGPRLLSRKARSGITYSLRALPLGGYCRFVGDVEDQEEGVEPPPDAFVRTPVWKRALISVSGPLMNVLTAFVLLFLLYFAIGLPTSTVPEIGAVIADMPAEEAGLEIGDKILRINGEAIESTQQASSIISATDGGATTFDIERDGAEMSVTVQPEWVDDEDGARYMIGIQYALGKERQTIGFGASVQGAAASTVGMAGMVVDVLRDLIFRGEGVGDLTGPIGTVTIIKERTQQDGLFQYVYLAAVISVNLGLFNLLPIPGLDGSKLIFLLIEKIRGKALDPNKEGLVTLIGFGFLALLMVFVLYQDIVRLVS